MCNEKIGDLSSIPMILYSSSLIHSYGDEHFYYTLRVFLGGWTVGIVVVHQIPKWDLHVVYFTPAWLTLAPLAIHGTHSPCAALIHVKLHHFSPVDYLFFFLLLCKVVFFMKNDGRTESIHYMTDLGWALVSMFLHDQSCWSPTRGHQNIPRLGLLWSIQMRQMI